MIRDVLREVVAELSTPEFGKSWTRWLGLATGHFFLGFAGAIISLAILPIWGPALLLALYVAKEVADVMRGGKRYDGAIDLGFVIVGGVAAVEPFAAVLIALAAMSAGVVMIIVRF